MRFRRSTAYLMLGAAILAGCRSNSNVDGLIRESQMREEFALRLQVQLDQCCRELQATRELLAAKEQQPSAGGSRRTMGDDGSPSDVKPPKIDLGPPSKTPTPATPGPAPKFEPGKTGVGNGGPPETTSGPEFGQMHSVAARRGEKVSAITLHRQLTSGYDADERRPGDEGLVVVVEPRNLGGEVVRVPGEMLIIAYDMILLRQAAAQPSNTQRVALVGKWEFTAEDAATWFEDGENRLRFELPWPPAGGPQNKDLRVVVKYKTADGRTLEAQTQVAVQLTGQRLRPPAGIALTPAAGPPTAVVPPPPGGGIFGIPPAGVSGEFSALKRPAPAVPSAPAPVTLPRREGLAPTEVSDARPGVEVPSRQRPIWSPYR